MTIKKEQKSSRIPIRFTDDDGTSAQPALSDEEQIREDSDYAGDEPAAAARSRRVASDESPDDLYHPPDSREGSSSDDDKAFELDMHAAYPAEASTEDEDALRAKSNVLRGEVVTEQDSEPNLKPSGLPLPDAAAGPVVAELVATRAELRRVEAELQKAQSELEEATAGQQDLTDRAARLQADFDNYRKRVERERSETHNAIVGEIVTKLLPVVDNFRRAVGAEKSASADSDDFRNFAQGVRLIEKQLGDILQSYGVEPVETIGCRFDPHIHEAIATEESGSFESETIIEEIVRGYRLRDRLLRPAMVKVAK